MRNHKQRRQLKRDGKRSEAGIALDFRTFVVRADSINEKDRSIEAVIASETPVDEMDFDRWEIIPTVLRMDGWQKPANGQIPFLNAHDRSSIANQLGSANGLRTEGNDLIGRLRFSETASAEFTKVREGHVTDVSVGYRPLEKRFVPDGKTQTINGRDYLGPVNVVTKWVAREVSLVPIGADEVAKMRGLDLNKPPRNPIKEFSMNPELRALLVSRGMSDKLTDDEAQKWQVDQLRKEATDNDRAAAEAKATKEKADKERAEKPETPDLEAIVSRQLADREAKRAEYVREVESLCDLGDVPAGDREPIRQATDLKAVRELIQKNKVERAAKPTNYGAVIVAGDSQRDKHTRHLKTALTMRAVGNVTRNEKLIDTVFPVAERDADAKQLQHASLFDIARECVEMDGIRTQGLSREQVAICAMGFPEQCGQRAPWAAYATTGSFSNLTQDAINKSMQVGYTEVPMTWEGPMRRGASVQDFKTIHRYRMGAIPNLPVWPDNTDPKQAMFADAQETYAVEAYSLQASFSYRLLINDDMAALSRTPAQLGAAAARTVNAVAWAQVTANGTMGDSVALFSAATGARKRSNLTTGSATPSVSTIQTMTNKMLQMRGENTPEGNESADILNLRPAYIVGPGALMTTINQLVQSAYDPAASQFMTFNPWTGLIPVIEPLLDVASTTAWYLFCSPSQLDTVEVTFLQGQEQPVIRDWVDPQNLARNWTVVQTFAAKALNHRGIQRHDGA
jgi:hypothetical protein